MDTQAEAGQQLTKLRGLVHIAAATRSPMIKHRTHALSCTSFRALQLGLKPLHPISPTSFT